MANEAEIINNPDSTPGAVSTGYQAQNTNLVAQRAGLDLSYVSGGAGTATVEISGPVDVNGVLYDIKSQTVLTPPSAGRYYITLQGAGPQYLTPTLGTSAGTFDALKNARYDSSGYRVLNWVIYYNGTTVYANRLLTPENEHTQIEDLNEPEESWITTNTTWIAKRSKYYTIYVTGSGAPGGSGLNAVSHGCGGGGAGATGIKRIWIDAGDIWSASFVSGSGGGGATYSTTFTDGTTTLICRNGYSPSSSFSWSGGGGSQTGSGFDIFFSGGGGGAGVKNYTDVGAGGYGGAGGNGGSSFWGGGGNGAIVKNDGSAVSATSGAYGSGGGGGSYYSVTYQSPAAAGASGVIRIIG